MGYTSNSVSFVYKIIGTYDFCGFFGLLRVQNTFSKKHIYPNTRMHISRA